MPVASRLVIVTTLGVLGLVAGCGGDDNGDSTGTPTRTATPTPRRTGTGDAASPTGDEKSPGPDESPDDGGTPVVSGTPPPTGVGGMPAPRVEDVSAFFAQFPSPPQDERSCVYNPSTRLIDCAGRGVYAPDPPPVGQGIECYLMTSDGNPVVVRCEVADPQATAYYDVR
jgi:hypothetical protein